MRLTVDSFLPQHRKPLKDVLQHAAVIVAAVDKDQIRSLRLARQLAQVPAPPSIVNKNLPEDVTTGIWATVVNVL